MVKISHSLIQRYSVIILKCLVLGIIPTLAMDLGNVIFSNLGIVDKINYQFIGALAHGWLKGVFFYNAASEVATSSTSLWFGVLAHYSIGIIFAFPILFLIVARNLKIKFSLLVIYGILTSAASVLFLFPSIGLGFFAVKAASPFYKVFGSLLHHCCYGFGLGAANNLYMSKGIKWL